LVKGFRDRTPTPENSSGLRACLIVATVCERNEIAVDPAHQDFREICTDVLLSRSKGSASQGRAVLDELLDEAIAAEQLSA
jgi:hypothetical protein